jgi:hypothetical protein
MTGGGSTHFWTRLKSFANFHDTNEERAAPNYESGGREFESLRARQHLAPIFRAKNIRFSRFLQGTKLDMIKR